MSKFVYVLELSGNKFYVGKTNSPEFRLQKHFDANGSAWTKKYKPLRVVEVVNGDDFDEDKYTLQYMQNYGIDNVRGGSFCELQLTQETKNVITKMLQSATDKCFNCGLSGHFANKCTASSVSSSEEEDETCTRCNRTGHVAKNCYAKTIQKKYSSSSEEEEAEETCTRCNRTGHIAKNCYAKTIQKKYSSSSEEEEAEETCTRCNRTGHVAKNCYAKTIQKNYSEDSSDEEPCTRCRHTGHNAKNCYAKINSNGNSRYSRYSRYKH
jgi:hypothetical protein